MPIKACPAVLRCRDPKSLRACLTIVDALERDDILDLRPVNWIDVGALAIMHFRALELGSIRLMLPTHHSTERFVKDHLKVMRGKYRYSPAQPNRFPIRYIDKARHLKREFEAWRTMLQHSGAVSFEEARLYGSTMSDLVMNSFTHGKPRRPCVLGGQTYPKSRHSSLVVIDGGLTIPVTLRRSGRYDDREDHEWILHSFERGVTAGTLAANRGYGLYYMVEGIEANGGSLLVVSGNGLAYVSPGGTPKSEPLGDKYRRFPGTLILLDLRKKGARR